MTAIDPSAPRSIRTRLRRMLPPVTSTLAMGAFVIALAAVLVARADALALRRSLVFVLGPLVLLVSLHARTVGYLHAPSLDRTWSLPIRPRDRFAAARTNHLRALAVLGVGWVVAVALAGEGSIGLVLDAAALVIAAMSVEPLAPALAAWLGRRVPAGSYAATLQRSLGGGWTLPEAVVHLYAPAAVLALAAAVAMPWQLAIDFAADGLAIPSGLGRFAIATAVVAIAAPIVTPRIYAHGVFEAVPWLVEATRTLAGPATPLPAPAWLLRIRDPGLRLVLLQHQRLSPVPRLRFWIMLAVTGVLAWRGRPLGAVEIVVAIGALAAWCVPIAALRREADARARLLAPLPVVARDRPAALLLLAPAVVATLVVAARSGGLAP